MDPGGVSYNISHALSLEGSLDNKRLEKFIATVNSPASSAEQIKRQLLANLAAVGKRRAINHTIPAAVNSNKARLVMTCQSGTVVEAIRINIANGDEKGMKLRVTAKTPWGAEVIDTHK